MRFGLPIGLLLVLTDAGGLLANAPANMRDKKLAASLMRGGRGAGESQAARPVQRDSSSGSAHRHTQVRIPVSPSARYGTSLAGPSACRALS